jgi:hypothetical protein
MRQNHEEPPSAAMGMADAREKRPTNATSG